MSKPERCSCCERGTQDFGRLRAQWERAFRDLLLGDPVPEGAAVVDVEVPLVAHGVHTREAQRELRRVQHRLDHAHVAVDLRARAAAGSAPEATAHSRAGRRIRKLGGCLGARRLDHAAAESLHGCEGRAALTCSGRPPQAGKAAAAWHEARGSQGVRISRAGPDRSHNSLKAGMGGTGQAGRFMLSRMYETHFTKVQGKLTLCLQAGARLQRAARQPRQRLAGRAAP